MARPFKNGLHYFPMDADILINRKIVGLMKQYGAEGMVVYLAAVCLIYKTNGYYAEYTREFILDVAYLSQAEDEQIHKILTYCLKLRLFDEQLMKKHAVFSSADIQACYCEARKKGPTAIDPKLALI